MSESLPRPSRIPLLLYLTAGAVAAAASLMADAVGNHHRGSIVAAIIELAAGPLVLAAVTVAAALTSRERRRFDAAGLPYGRHSAGALDVTATRRDALQIAGEAMSALDAFDLEVDWDKWLVTSNNPATLKWGGREMHATVSALDEYHAQIRAICRPRRVLLSKPRPDLRSQTLLSAYFDQCQRLAASANAHEHG